MSLGKLIEKLAAFEPSGFPFITVYLNAEANEHGRDEFGPWLRNELAGRTGDYEEESAEAESFNQDLEKILNFVDKEVDAAANGVAIFACSGADGFFETVQLEVAK
jgi:peptide subunit release factor 1 (eRF1)